MIVASARRSMRWHESDAAHWVVDGGRGVLPRVFKVPMLENGPFYPCFFLHPRACVWLKSALQKWREKFPQNSVNRAETAFNGSGTVEIAC